MDEKYEEYENNTAKDKIFKLAKDAPQLPIGLLALCAVVGHGLYNLKGRKEKLSLYLIHYRVAAQGTFLGCLTIGLAYTIFRDHILKKFKNE